MRADVVALVILAACEKTPKPVPASCEAYAQKQLANAVAGALRGAPQVKYVRDELAAKYRGAVVQDCSAMHASYVECVVKATGEEHCADALSDDDRRAVATALAGDALAASLAATTAVASVDECREVATRMAMVLQRAATDATRAKIPSADAIAELCQRAGWSAFYVRCTNAGDKSCNAEPAVMAGVKALILESGR